MEAGRAEQRAAARRIRRAAEGSGSRKSEPTYSVTIVALISRAGMMSQHANGRVSRANSPWERSMQREKQLTGHRSQLALAAYRSVTTTSLPRRISSPRVATFAGWSAALRPQVYSYQPTDLGRAEDGRGGEGSSIRRRPTPDRSWRVIPATLFGVSTRLIGSFAACGEIAFSGFLLAFMSWTIAQVLAGCAAYAQAMYPTVIETEPRERMDSPAGEPGELVLLRQPRKPRAGAAAVAVECIVRSEAARVDPAGWPASIASLWEKFRSNMGRRRARRLAIAELRTLDDR